MAGSMQQILMPITLTKVISRVAANTDAILDLFQFGPGGKNCSYLGHGREGSYQVYNNVRAVAQGRAPGTAAGRRPRNPIGRVPFVYPRMHDSISLLAEEIHNIAKIGDPRARDEAGKDYIRRQTKSLSQLAGNWRTALTVGMLRDSLYMVADGDSFYPTYTNVAGSIRYNFQMPSGNKLRCDMLGAGNIISATWLTASTNIPRDFGGLQSAMSALNGGLITDALCSRLMWNNILGNDYVQEYAGIANAPFKEWIYEAGSGEDGKPLTEMRGSINAIPGVTFHITDNGLDIGAPGSTPTFTKHIPDDSIAFFCDPKDPDLYSMYEGSEPIAEFDGGPETVKAGMAAWSTKTANPTNTNVFILDNALPINHVPDSIIYATPVF